VSTRSPNGFSLIELLVACTVIAILMGMVFTVVRSARSTALGTSCISNLHQFGHALAAYMDAHNECIPRRGQGMQKLARIDRMCDWFNCLMPELGSPPYFEMVARGTRPKEGDRHPLICPSSRDPGWQYFLPYAMNIYLSPWIRPEPHRLYELPHPATMAFLADAPGTNSSTMPSNQEYGVVARHSGHANILFLDAHVSAFEASYIGCGVGDPRHPDLRWDTESEGVNWKLGGGG